MSTNEQDPKGGRYADARQLVSTLQMGAVALAGAWGLIAGLMALTGVATMGEYGPVGVVLFFGGAGLGASAYLLYVVVRGFAALLAATADTAEATGETAIALKRWMENQ